MRRRWKTGDTLELRLPMKPRLQSTPDDARTFALLHGPLVLAADLGSAAEPFDATAPAFVGGDPLDSLVAIDRGSAVYRSRGSVRPTDRVLSPFFSQYDRRTAVYFRRYAPDEWQNAIAAAAAERERERRLDARALDVIRLGDETDERRHRLESAISYPLTYRMRAGRDARTGGYFEFDAAVDDAPLALQAIYWGGERDRVFHIEVNGTRIATERLDGAHPAEFIEREYSLPPEIAGGRKRIRVRFQPEPGYRAGPVFGCRVLRL